MSTTFYWFARLVDPQNRPVQDLKVDVQLFDRTVNGWVTTSSAVSSPKGLLRGKGVIRIDSPLLAPAMRLVESELAVVFSATPRLSQTSKPLALNVDFGELMLLAEAIRFVQPRAAFARVADDSFVIGALVGPAAEAAQPAEFAVKLEAIKLDAMRAEVTDEVTLDFKAVLAEKNIALAASEKLVFASEQELFQANKTIAILRAENTRVDRDPVGVSEFTSMVGAQIGGAQTALKATGFSLGQVSLTARILVSPDTKINFPNKVELKDIPAGALSDLVLQFNPDRQPTNEASLLVPDLQQLTEGAARRVLVSLGLVLDASYGSRDLQPDVAEGQAMLQSPTAGAVVARGGRVLVIFARNSN